ncbi:MAG: hypothetical protein HC794_08045 [Nitrospiraceae bacterium]|nr:hypothetical protein [Nitrospiraceae bacterium]
MAGNPLSGSRSTTFDNSSLARPALSSGQATPDQTPQGFDKKDPRTARKIENFCLERQLIAEE